VRISFGSAKFLCSTGKNSKKRLFRLFATGILASKWLILFEFDTNSATLQTAEF